MAYRIRPSERFSEEFRAAGTEQLEDAINVLTLRPEGLLEAIHSARKNFKKLRSLYRLAAADIRPFQRAENVRIRDMAKSLSAFRDTIALVESSRYLLEHSRGDDERAALERIIRILTDRRDERVKDKGTIENSISAAIATCGDAIEALSQVTFKKGTKRDATRIRKGWRKVLKRAHAARQACENSIDAAPFHQLRKRGQDYRHYLHLLQDLWPSAMLAQRAAVSDMVDLLGHHNDLALLTSLANQQPHLFANGEDVAHLQSAVTARQELLRQSALELTDTIFLDPPDEEARRVALLWRDVA